MDSELQKFTESFAPQATSSIKATVPGKFHRSNSLAGPELKKHSRIGSLVSLVKQNSIILPNKRDDVTADVSTTKNAQFAPKASFSQSPSLKNVNVRKRMQTLLKLEIDDDIDDESVKLAD